MQKNFEDMLKIYSEYSKKCMNMDRDALTYPILGILITLDSSFEHYILSKYKSKVNSVMRAFIVIKPIHRSTLLSYATDIITFQWKAIYHRIIKVMFDEPEKMETEIDEYRWKIIGLCIEQELKDIEKELEAYYKE